MEEPGKAVVATFMAMMVGNLTATVSLMSSLGILHSAIAHLAEGNKNASLEALHRAVEENERTLDKMKQLLASSKASLDAVKSKENSD